MKEIIIRNFGVAGYRSFGPEVQQFGPFNKVNLFIGPNNAGKSNLLRFISDCIPSAVEAIRSSHRMLFSMDDRHLRQIQNGMEIMFTTTFNPGRFRNKYSGYLSGTDYAIPIAEYFLRQSEQNEFIFRYCFQSVVGENSSVSFIQTNLEPFVEIVRSHTEAISARTTAWDVNTDKFGKMLAADYDSMLPQTSQGRIPLIPAFRQITLDNDASKAGDETLAGQGLIRLIASWLNHRGDERIKKQKKEILLKFVRQISGYETASLTAVDQDTALEINVDGEAYPLDDVATGFHQIVLLAAYCLEREFMVICLEEPECHLHPTWQRALIRYLAENTKNQYFISTHSAHIIDLPGVSVHCLMRENGVTKVKNDGRERDLLVILRDLGYRASDLLQSNYILWVEGPSDRLYIIHWLSTISPELVEGIHYSIMFYSGSMLKHLSVRSDDLLKSETSSFTLEDESETDDDDSVPEPILLRRLNQNFGLVMDSDRKGANLPSGKKWSRIQRIKGEMEHQQNFAWITDGRTTENYTNPEIMARAVKRINANYVYVVPKNEFCEAFNFLNTSHTETYDKVHLAEQYVLQIKTDQKSEKTNPDNLGESEYYRSKMGQLLISHIHRLAEAIRAVQAK